GREERREETGPRMVRRPAPPPGRASEGRAARIPVRAAPPRRSLRTTGGGLAAPGRSGGPPDQDCTGGRGRARGAGTGAGSARARRHRESIPADAAPGCAPARAGALPPPPTPPPPPPPPPRHPPPSPPPPP